MPTVEKLEQLLSAIAPDQKLCGTSPPDWLACV